jgi:hypothetical protein
VTLRSLGGAQHAGSIAAPLDVPQSDVGVRNAVFVQRRIILMLDVVMLAIGLGFFVLSIAYAFACDEL